MTPKTELDHWLAQGLSAKLHWFHAPVPVVRLAEVLTGLANHKGGTVLIGIDTGTGDVLGVPNVDLVVDKIFQAALLVDPPLVLPIPRTHTLTGLSVLSVSVPQGLPHAYSLDGRYLIRRGQRTVPISSPKLRAMLVARGAFSFESRIPEDAQLSDIDWEKVDVYRQTLDLPSDEDLEDLLLRRGCTRSDKGGQFPTYAALLLFGRHPQQWLPNAAILAARFPGTSFSDAFIKQEIRGTLPEQLRQAQAFGRDNLRTAVRLIDLERVETPELPLAALREVLVNAVAHRDYNQGGDTIHLHLFADRLEVSSPGILSGPVTMDNMLEVRFSRNPVIAQVLSDLGFVERLGYGLNRVITVMNQHNLHQPKFEEIGGSFRVTLGNAVLGAAPLPSSSVLEKYADHNLNLRQKRALGYLAQRARINSRDYQTLCPDVSPETLRRDLADMVNKDLLLKMGTKRGTYYILKA